MMPMLPPNAIRMLRLNFSFMFNKAMRMAAKKLRFLFSCFSFIWKALSWNCSGGRFSSLMILPSSIVTMRVEREATRSEWVTMMTSLPVFAMS